MPSHYDHPAYQRNRARLIELTRQQEGPLVTCPLCRGVLDLDLTGRTPRSVSVDHVVPLDQGGTHDLDNLALVHMGCNARRGSLHRAIKHGNRINGAPRRRRPRPPLLTW